MYSTLRIYHIENVCDSELLLSGSMYNLKAGDLKLIEKGKDLMDCGKIDACSYVQTATAFFFTGIVSAAMKESVG